MSLYIHVQGQQPDVERFYKEIIYPDLGRLREDERFRVTKNDMKYWERNHTTHTVERMIQGYSRTLQFHNRPGLWEQYVVEYEDLPIGRIGVDLPRIKGVQVKVHFRGNLPSELKLFYDEVIAPKTDEFIIEQDTGLYRTMKGYASRLFGGHFPDAECKTDNFAMISSE